MARPIPTNPLRSLTGYQLRRASAVMMDELARELAAIDVRTTEASILLLISANPMIKPSEVGRELGIQRANVTPLISGLERRGLVSRAAMDGRSQGLSLTEAGRTASAAAFAIMQDHDRRLRDRLQADREDQLATLLSRLWTEHAAPPCDD